MVSTESFSPLKGMTAAAAGRTATTTRDRRTMIDSNCCGGGKKSSRGGERADEGDWQQWAREAASQWTGPCRRPHLEKNPEKEHDEQAQVAQGASVGGTPSTARERQNHSVEQTHRGKPQQAPLLTSHLFQTSTCIDAMIVTQTTRGVPKGIRARTRPPAVGTHRRKCPKHQESPHIGVYLSCLSPLQAR